MVFKPLPASFDVCEAHATHENGVLNIDVLLQHDRRIPSLCEELNNISLGHSSEVNKHLTPFFDFFVFYHRHGQNTSSSSNFVVWSIQFSRC
jgi:hypothetical protein